MNCRQCGAPIPAALLKKERFACPECGKVYRRKSTQTLGKAPAKSARRPKAKKGVKAFLTKRVWKLPMWAILLIGLFVAGSFGGSDKSIDGQVSTQAPTSAPVRAMPVEQAEETMAVLSLNTPEATPEATYEPTPEHKPETTPEPTSAATPQTTEEPSLKKGDKGDAVKSLQKSLIALGYMSGKADGVYGEGTVKAVSAFQKGAGLPQTGVCDLTTAARIKSQPVPQTKTQTKEKTVYVTKTGKKYHKRSCRTIANSKVTAISESKAKKKYGRCKVCNP